MKQIDYGERIILNLLETYRNCSNDEVRSFIQSRVLELESDCAYGLILITH